MRVLVTGATGFVGLACVEKFHAAGWEVVATGRNVAEWETSGVREVEFIRADLSNIEECQALPAQTDCVVHCAALSSPWGSKKLFESANVVALQNILALTLANRFIHISSSAVNFAYTTRQNERETVASTTRAPNYYVSTKRRAEALVLQSGVPCVVLRPHAIIGARDPSIIPRVMRLAQKGVVPLIGPDTKLDLTHVTDVAEAAFLAATAPNVTGKRYNITGGAPVSRFEAFETLFRAANKKVEFVRVPYPVAMAAAFTLECLSYALTMGVWEPPITRFSASEVCHGVTLDITRARTELGYSPRRNPLQELQKIGQLWM